MPIKKDDSGRRWVEMEVVVPGSPEQVWEAVATGAGNSAWFTRTTIDERVGGAIHFDFGPNGKSHGEVIAWDPPHRFAYVEREWAEGAPPIETEITVTTRSGDRCVLRMVHSLFASTDDWNDQMEGFENGWPAFFAVLDLTLRHFVGRPAANFVVFERVPAGVTDAWRSFSEVLGVRGGAPGDVITLRGAENWPLVVERVRQDRRQMWTILRGEPQAELPGVVMVSAYQLADRTQIGLTAYYYGDDAPVAASAGEARWSGWLPGAFGVNAL
jgi:uncharacterized protein YndB with AHSA1/START domain